MTNRLLASLLATALSGLASAQCLESTSSELQDLLVRADEAFRVGDPPALQQALDESALVLPCVAQVLAPDVAAHYHRVYGLGRYLDDDEPRARDAFAAARTITGAHALPEALVPAGHPLQGLFARAAPAETFVPAPHPEAGRVYFDGGAADRPVGSATIFQRTSADGAVVETAWLTADQALPAYPSATAPPEPVRAPPRARTAALRVGALASGALAAGLYGGAVVTHGRYVTWDPTRDARDLERLREANHRLVAGSALATVGAVGLGVVSVVVTR